MYKHRIELVGLEDVNNFIKVVSRLPGRIDLIDGKGYAVSAKSFLGCRMASTEWSELYCVSDTDIYTHIEKFCVEGSSVAEH